MQAVVLIVWAVLLFCSMLLSMFIHECAHGLGAKLVGNHVSTGFNRVGNPGKKPGDPDFRQGHVITGKPTLSGVAGPVVNWVLGLALACALWSGSIPVTTALAVGSAAVANALMRLMPMAFFFVRCFLGHPVLEDEVAWGLGAIKKVQWPLLSTTFAELAKRSPEIILRERRVMLWPAGSLTISAIIVVLAFYRLLAHTLQGLLSFWGAVCFVLVPALVGPVALLVGEWLDRRVRINW